MRLAEIEPRDVKALIAWLATQPNPHVPSRTLSPSTIGYHVAVIRALFADAVEEGVLRHSPTTGIRVAVREPVEDEAVKAMTRTQLARLLDELDDQWRLFFEFLAHTGLRISEAIEVRWGRDIELAERPTLKLRRQYTDGAVTTPKSAAGRRDIPLSAGMAERLRAIEGPAGTLAFTTITGRRLNRSNHYRDAATRRGAAAAVGELGVLIGPVAAAISGAPQRPGDGRVDLLVPREDHEQAAERLLAADAYPDGLEEAPGGAERRERWVAGRGRLTLRWSAAGVGDIAGLRERAHPVLVNQNGAGLVRVALVEDLADLCEDSPWSEDALYRTGLQAVLASGRYSTRRPREERLELA